MKKAFQFPQEGTYKESVGPWNRLITFLLALLKSNLVVQYESLKSDPGQDKAIAERMSQLCLLANNGNKEASATLSRILVDDECRECVFVTRRPLIGILKDGGYFFELTKTAKVSLMS